MPSLLMPSALQSESQEFTTARHTVDHAVILTVDDESSKATVR